MLYEFIIKDKAGNVIALLDTATNRSFASYLNKPGDASFNLPLNDPKLNNNILLLGSKELYIYREGIVVWGGELQTRRISLSEGQESVQVTAKGFLDLLSKKIVGSPVTPRVFTNEDLSTIGWEIIDDAQTGTNASFGITQGALATSRDADRTWEGKTVKDCLMELSNENVQDGIDIEIDQNKQFSTFYPQKGNQKDNVVFEYGKNIMSINESQDATQMANQIILIGAGNGPEALLATRNALTTVQAEYKIRQKLRTLKDVSVLATLNEHGDKELEETAVQNQGISLSYNGVMDPGFGAFDVGDSVRVIVNRGLLSIDQYLRVSSIKVSISDNDDEDINVGF